MTSFIGLRWQIWHPTPLVASEVACQRPFYCVHLLRRWRRRVSWRPRKFIHCRLFEPQTSHNFVHFWHMASCVHCCVKSVLLSCDNHPQNVRLSTHKMHCGATVQLAVPETWQECFYTTLYMCGSNAENASFSFLFPPCNLPSDKKLDRRHNMTNYSAIFKQHVLALLRVDDLVTYWKF